MAKTAKRRPSIGLATKTRRRIEETLSKNLSNHHLPSLSTRNFLGSITGGRFRSSHVHLGTMCEDFAPAFDETAERIRLIEGVAPGSMERFPTLATSKGADKPFVPLVGAIEGLRQGHEAVIRKLREDIQKTGALDDLGTEGALASLLRRHQQST